MEKTISIEKPVVTGAETNPSQYLEDAEAAVAWEHSLTPRRALRLYSRAVKFAAFVSLILVMEGFDTKVLGSLYAVPAFKRDFGQLTSKGKYEVSAPWQSGMSGIQGVTMIGGMFLGGYVTEKFGFRKTMMWTLLSIAPINFAFFFAPSIEVLAVAVFLFSIPLGIFQTITTVYVTEIMPSCLRPYLTSCYSLSWAFGQLLNAVVFRGTLTLPSPWTYRVPFALQWFWPVLIIGGIYLAPESPWWLVRQGRVEEAEAIVANLTTDDLDIEVKKIVALMAFTTEHERSVHDGTSYIACFKGANLRRTVIVMGVYIMQVLSGAPLRAWMTYFFLQGGLAADQSFNMTIVVLCLSVAGVLGAWVVLTFVGRRRMYLAGNLVGMLLFIAIGCMGIGIKTSGASNLAWGIGSLLAIDGFVANLLILPITFVLVSEIPSSLLRTKSVVLARNTYSVVNIVAGTITPYMLNPTAWNWGALTGFFWAGAALIGFVFTFTMIPESKGKTVAEMDYLFEQKTPVRKFKKAQVSLSNGDIEQSI
ncbi:general substrate transporter [Aaosphaeria arxii CBS 175.79]|uniref:General substrate transporter n=1 Tax=Aaosphaeria arxii CBS 175.79 TaxID=1450172 RepID=A0A6A5XV36_9PLEO|nr:general substrate transporter [Aaosphaeria arxii CBS 175.79]KAF2016809.1 general substrate transporter [Aaosphaeria arxii CBS 175.79]